MSEKKCPECGEEMEYQNLSVEPTAPAGVLVCQCGYAEDEYGALKK